jgi:hypothetical protein
VATAFVVVWIIVRVTPEAVAVAATASRIDVALERVAMVSAAGIPVAVMAAPTSAVVKLAVAEVTVVDEFSTPSLTLRVANRTNLNVFVGKGVNRLVVTNVSFVEGNG